MWLFEASMVPHKNHGFGLLVAEINAGTLASVE